MRCSLRLLVGAECNFPEGYESWKIHNLYKNVVKSGFVADVDNFARFFVKIICVFQRRHVGRLDLVQDLGIRFIYRLVNGKLLFTIIDYFQK